MNNKNIIAPCNNDKHLEKLVKDCMIKGDNDSCEWLKYYIEACEWSKYYHLCEDPHGLKCIYSNFNLD